MICSIKDTLASASTQRPLSTTHLGQCRITISFRRHESKKPENKRRSVNSWPGRLIITSGAWIPLWPYACREIGAFRGHAVAWIWGPDSGSLFPIFVDRTCVYLFLFLFNYSLRKSYFCYPCYLFFLLIHRFKLVEALRVALNMLIAFRPYGIRSLYHLL